MAFGRRRRRDPTPPPTGGAPRIRLVREQRPGPDPGPEPPDLAVPEPESGPAPDENTGVVGRFTVPERVLGCWAAFRAVLDDLGRDETPSCHEAPDGGLWVFADVPHATGAGLVWAAGGEAYAFTATRIESLRGAAHPPPEPAVLGNWPRVGVLNLLANTAPRAPRDAAFGEVAVLTAGRLANVVIRRALSEGADVTYQPVERLDLDTAELAPAVLLKLTADETLPRTLIRRLARLPYTVVARVADQQETLLVDVGLTLPVEDAHLVREVPAGQQWVIGRPGAGAWTVAATGRAVRADGMLTAPALPLTPGLPETGGARRMAPASIPVDLVPSPRHGGIVDAVLLEDADLDRLRRYLQGRPLSEDAFLILGPGVHVLTEPVRLTERVPFGTPLRRVGPGGLYLAAGHALRPALSPSARASLFSVRRGRVVVVRPGGAVEFRTADTIPAWSLWLPEEPPAFAAGISQRGRTLLERLEKISGAAPAGPTSDDGDDPAHRVELRRSAMQAELDGDLSRAARLLEEAGDFARAGWAFEEAARTGDDRTGDAR